MTLSYVVPKQINNARENDSGPYYLRFSANFIVQYFFPTKIHYHYNHVFPFSRAFIINIDKIRIPLFFL